MKELLKNRDAIIIWLSRAFSRFGDSVEDLAQMFLVTELTDSAFAVGLTMVFSAIPNILVSPFAGAIVDRYNKKFIMVTCEIVRAVVLIVMSLLIALDVIKVWEIYFMVTIGSIAESFYEPCSGVVNIQVVGKENLSIMNSLMSTTNSILRTIGYSVAGILMVMTGTKILFFIDGITFVVSAFSASILRIKAEKNEKINGCQDILYDIKAAIKYVKTTSILPILFLAYLIINSAIIPISGFIPQIITLHLKLDINSVWSGYLPTIFSAMTILGQVIYPILDKMQIKLKIIYFWGFMAMGVSVMCAAFIHSIVATALMFIITAFFATIIMSWSGTELSRQCSTNYLGRVMSLTSMIILAGTPLTSAISGVLMDKISLSTIFLIVSIILIFMGVILRILISQKVKENIPVDVN